MHGAPHHTTCTYKHDNCGSLPCPPCSGDPLYHMWELPTFPSTVLITLCTFGVIQKKRKGLPPDFADMIGNIAKLQGINPARGPIMISAPQHLAISIMGLHCSVKPLNLLQRVLETIFSSGLFCGCDGYFDYLHRGDKFGREPHVTDEVAVKGLGVASRVHIANTILRRLIPRDLSSVCKRASHHTHHEHIRSQQYSAIAHMLESVRVNT